MGRHTINTSFCKLYVITYKSSKARKHLGARLDGMLCSYFNLAALDKKHKDCGGAAPEAAAMPHNPNKNADPKGAH